MNERTQRSTADFKQLGLPGPVAAAFVLSLAFLRALIGPMYSGKKASAFADVLFRPYRYRMQRQWRWMIVSPTTDYQTAHVIPMWRTLVPHQVGKWGTSRTMPTLDVVLNAEDGSPFCEIGLNYVALDRPERQRLTTLETTGICIVDARNVAEAVLDDCLASAGSYPRDLDGGSSWCGVSAVSRMPKPGHWLITRTDLELFRQPGGRSGAAENLPALRQRNFSYQRLAEKWHPDRVRVEIDAELGSSAAETAQEADRQSARDSFTPYIGIVAPDIMPATHHQLLIRTLERVAAGELKRVMFFLPPGSAKSTYASVLFPPWYMGRNPTHSLILASHTRELAERFGRRARNTVDSPQYRDVFGFGLAPDSGAAGRWENQRGGEFYAVGVDGSVTGRRADLGIIDDPVKGRTEADSPTVRQHTWDWYKADFWTRLKPGAALIYIGTRWHDDDLAGRLIEEMKSGGEQFEIISVPAIAKDADPLGRQPGERLWPEWYTDEMFEIAQRDPRNWSALYQQEPMPESGDYFKQDWLRWYDKQPPLDQLRRYGTSDFAVTAGGGDYTVHLVAGVDAGDDIYLLDLFRGQVDAAEGVERRLALIRQWRPRAWGDEKGQIARGIGPFLRKREQECRIYIERIDYPATGDKSVRAQAIRGRLAQGKVFLPRSAAWTQAFVDELLRFPAGKYDDQVDAFSLLGQMLPGMVGAGRPKPAPEEAWPGMPNPPPGSMEWLAQNTGPGARWGYPPAPGYRNLRI